MQKRAKCPLCGMVVWRSQIEKSHNIDILEMSRVVRPKGRGGFKYTKSEDVGLVALVRAKIKYLYNKYFPTIKLAPSVRARGGVRAGGGVRVPSGALLRPGILTATVVRE